MNFNQKLDLIQNSNLIVGIDIAKKVHVATIVNSSGRELKVGIKIPNSSSGYNHLSALLKPYEPKSILLAMEPTGHYYKSLAYNFKKKGYEIVLVNPYHTKLSKEIGTNCKSKNDVKDSRLVAKLAQEGKFSKSLLLTGKYAELRKITLVREQQVQNHTQTLMRVHTLLDEFLPEYDGLFKNIDGTASLALLKTYGLSKLRSADHIQEKAKLIVAKSRGQINVARAENIVKSLVNSIGVSEGIMAAELELTFLLNQIMFHKENIAAAGLVIDQLLNDIPEAKHLLELNGVGSVTLGTLLGQTGSFDQYTNAKQLEKLAGLSIVENKSGSFKGKMRISKRGRDLLRCTLYRIAMTLIANNIAFRKYYEYRVNTLKKPKMIAVTAVQIKFLKIMFSMVKNNTKFDGNLVNKGLPQT